jgi:hypothetical protein
VGTYKSFIHRPAVAIGRDFVKRLEWG